MSFLRLPHGVEMPRLGLGTFELQGAACAHVVEEALALGYRHIDTAEGYGNEVEVGRAVRAAGVPRTRVFLTSKVWRDHLTAPDLRRRLVGTLERLGTDHLDLYLVHWPNRDVPAAETAGAMEALRGEGLLRAWGVSNYTVGHLEEALRHGAVATNQVELHPYFRQEALSRYCRQRGLPITAYSPLARGHATREPVLLEIGREHGRSAAQIALAWALAKGHAVIPKASRPEHLRANLEALDVRLTADEEARIEMLPQRPRIFEYEWSEFQGESAEEPQPPRDEAVTTPRAPVATRGRRASRSREPRIPSDIE